MFAHKDDDGLVAEFGSVNQLRFYFSNGTLEARTIDGKITDERAKELIELTSILIPKMEYHMDKFVKKHFHSSSIPDGEYLLSLEDEESSWLRHV